MPTINRGLSVILIIILLSVAGNIAFAQGTLARNISIHVKNQRLGTVLKTMEEKGKFYFSYNSNIVKTDSLVTVDADNWTIKEVLDQMLTHRFEYKVARDFIILRYAPLQLTLTTEKSATENDEYAISGFITDEQSGRRLPNASVYEKSLLQSTLTDANGFFEIHLKNEGATIRLTVSKENYKDTTITFLKDVNVTIRPDRSVFSYVADNDYDGIENTSLGRLFLSAKQQIQSANLSGLIANAPFQASAIPNVSTHGTMNGQIVNKVSLNAVGGYNAGVDGFELGIIFNLDKGDVRSVQIAGVFNVVGGSVGGVQLGGLYNNVLGNVNGVQLAILHNSVKRNLRGAQLSLYNHVKGEVSGIQIAPVGNIANKNVRGIQIAAIGNVVHKKFEGVQIGGLFNYAKNLRGMQIGLVNIADTSSGVSLGLINYVRSGYFKVGLFTNETLNANIALKSGSRNFYTVYTGGARLSSNKMYGLGLGFGSIMGSDKFSFNPEIGTRYLYEGTWRYANLLNRLDANFNIRLGKKTGIIAGPSLNYYYTEQHNVINGYALAQNLHHNFGSGPGHAWWVGWNVGLNFF